MDAVQAVKAARDVTEKVAPLCFDCGRVCGSACCKQGEQGEGMLLFPGEEALYRSLPQGFSLKPYTDLPGTFLLTCSGVCRRSQRPLACRFFPLTPLARRDAQGNIRLRLALDRRAWPVCPLMESGFRGLAPSFIEACKEATRLLFSSEEQRAFLLGLDGLMDAYRLSLWEESAT